MPTLGRPAILAMAPPSSRSTVGWGRAPALQISLSTLSCQSTVRLGEGMGGASRSTLPAPGSLFCIF